VTIRGTLLTITGLLWLAALGCWLRARSALGLGRLSREGWLFLLLGVPFLIAGVFFTSSSYPHEVVPPSPPPVVAVATPAPAPARATPRPLTYDEAVTEAQYAAVARYPELGKAGSAFNNRFVSTYRERRSVDPDFFARPDWPVRLADEIARTPSVEP
jgi:hypothetical protein